MNDSIFNDESLYSKVCCNGIIYTLAYYNLDNEEWSPENILYYIENKNEIIEKFLACIDSFGMLNSLLALTLIIDTNATKDVSEWFYNCLKRNTDYALIEKLKKAYILKINPKSVAIPEEFQEVFKHKMIDFTEREISTFIWENIYPEYVDSISCLDDKIMGIWHMGVYTEKYNKEYHRNLEEIVFPYLINKSKDIKEYLHEGASLKISLYRRILHSYLFEVFIFNKLYLESAINNLINKDFREVAIENCIEFKKMICYEANAASCELYVSEAYVDQIAKLIRIFEYFENYESIIRIDGVKSLLPLFYLFIGANEKAYKYLLEIESSPLDIPKVRTEYLIAFYRCLLTNKNEIERKKMIGIFDEIYLNKSIIPQFVDILSDLSFFYLKWTKRIKKDIKNDKIDIKVGFNDSFVLFCKKWVINDKISNKFKCLVEDIKGSDEQKKAEAIVDSIELMFGLVSHAEHAIRILESPIERAFRISDYIDNGNEIFDNNLYTKSELITIRGLKARFDKIRSHILSKSTIESYIKIKDNIIQYWAKEDRELLCNKILTALRGIQSDPINIWRNGLMGEPRHEESLNGLVAFFLRGYYGEKNVQRECPQGVSSSGKDIGALDIVVFNDNNQFSIIEALRLLSLDVKGKLLQKDIHNIDDHLKRLMEKYDPRGVGIKFLIIYAYINSDGVFGVIEDYMKGYFSSIGDMEKIKEEESSIGHLKVEYKHEGNLKEVHILTVLMKDVNI